MLWRDYFPTGTIVGIDLKLPKEFKSGNNIYMYQGNQADKDFLSRVSNEIAPEGFAIIIDDASHIGELTKISFWHLFDNHLKSGGLYVIEDWGTGYWDDWLDGKSLDFKKYNQRPNRYLFKFQKILMRVVRFMPWPLFADPLKPAPMPSHSYGMVGFVKQLIDEQAASDVSRKKMSGKPLRDSKFEKIVITPSLVFIYKA